MTKVLVTESSLEAIADAIRTKNGSGSTYKPGQMAAAIRAIQTPNLEALSITQNGNYTPSSGKNGFSSVAVNVPNSYVAGDEGKVVSNGALVAQTARATEITQNGTYSTVANSSVTVNVPVSGFGAYIPENFLDYAVDNNKNIGITYNPTTEAVTVGSLEYSGCIYGNSSMINTYGLVLLGDFSQGTGARSETLLGSIENYSSVILQGIYNKNRTSNYNTSMIYPYPELNKSYWAGMKDRNNSYDCYVTFTDATHVSLGVSSYSKGQVIIYGMP